MLTIKTREVVSFEFNICEIGISRCISGILCHVNLVKSTDVFEEPSAFIFKFNSAGVSIV